MNELQAIEAVNSVTGPVIWVLLILLTLTMGYRVIRHLRSHRKTPLLLARDFVTFAYLLLLTAGSQYSRWTGVRLGQQLWWIVLSSVLAIAVIGLWVAVEIGFVRQQPSTCVCVTHCPPGSHPEEEQ